MANKVSNPDSIIERLRSLRVALVHDDLVQEARGGEELFLAISELFPQAEIYTSMATGEWVKRIASSQQPGASSRKIFTSFMQKIPLKKKLQRVLFLLYPLAFESFDFSDYDLVISSSSRFAHGIITKPETKHVCYMNNPGRMFWEPESYFGERSKIKTVLSPALSYFRLWSFTAAQRVDQFVANSKHIAGKIERYFGRDAEVVYPFVDLERYVAVATKYSNEKISNRRVRMSSNDYYLVVTRLNRWKRVDIAIEVINRLNTRMRKSSNHSNKKEWKLVVVGEGPERKHLEAGSRKQEAGGGIEFLGNVSRKELALLYQNCIALIMTQEEDFGITALEAQASGRPVIAYGVGGVLETVRPGRTGEFFSPQTAEALAKVLRGFEPEKYDPTGCRKNAEKFSKERFQRGLLAEVEKIVNSR